MGALEIVLLSFKKHFYVQICHKEVLRHEEFHVFTSTFDNGKENSFKSHKDFSSVQGFLNFELLRCYMRQLKLHSFYVFVKRDEFVTSCLSHNCGERPAKVDSLHNL